MRAPDSLRLPAYGPGNPVTARSTGTMRSPLGPNRPPATPREPLYGAVFGVKDEVGADDRGEFDRAVRAVRDVAGLSGECFSVSFGCGVGRLVVRMGRREAFGGGRRV